MSKCEYTDNGKVLNFLYNDSTTNSSNYIIDETKINKLNDLFTIKTLDAELDKNAPIKVGENGIISNINLGSKGRYYSDERPNIIIKPPASPDGTPAKATAVMIQRREGIVPNENIYWEIDKIEFKSRGSGYDAVKDIDKIEIERKNTAQKKIIYNEAKPNYYLLEKKESQCNNLTDRWHNWFTIPYYYLGNNDGRRKIDESDKTRRIFQCYNKCADNYVVNNDSGANICESIETFNDGKYEKYISYDPLAIICILGSKLESNVINQGVPGNYYHTIQNIKSADVDVDINTEVRDKILASLGNKKYRDNNNNPVVIIKKDIDEAYDKLVKYIEDIIKEAEKDDSKIKKKIKDDIGKFYMLFDTRDKLYISYLDKLKAAIPFKRVLYAKSIAHTQSEIPNKNDTDTHTYLNYLFKYCKFLYFDEKNNTFATRLLNYGIYETNYITKINNPDEEDELAKTTKHIPTPINYNPVTVKIDTKHKNIFDDYSNAYELYKSFILTYPIILLLSVGLCIIIMFAYWSNFIYYTASFLNSLYIFVIGVLYFFIVLLVCNSVVIKIVVFIISTTYKVANFIYNTIIDAFSYTFVRIILFFILITALANNDLSSFVYAIIMYILNTIIYFTMGIISIFLYIIYGFIYLKSEVIIPSLIILSIMYLYYKIWFNFDINTLDKEMKKNTKIINEHSNITTILKSDAGATISTARFELYKHSYFSNLYEKALDNYKEKIEEIEKYQNNKELSNNNSSDNEKAKENEKDDDRSVLTKKNKELQDKIDNAEIAREQRKSVQTKIRDLKIDDKDDKELKEINDELKITSKSDEKLSRLNTKKEQLLSEFKDKRKKLLEDKVPLLDKLNTLKKKEAEARNDINTNNISKTANKGIDAALSSVKGLNNFADIKKGKAIDKLFNLTN